MGVLLSKTPEENESDMEAGMTTAERRRRRRRGGGLRVPSDNVPRRISSPAVATDPDDPSGAVAIAYNGTDSLLRAERQSISVPDPVAPEAVSTLIDPPHDVAIEEVSFESKTREMSAVDLEELGLGEVESKQDTKPAAIAMSVGPSTVVVDEEVFTDNSSSGRHEPVMVSMSGHSRPDEEPTSRSPIVEPPVERFSWLPASVVAPVPAPAAERGLPALKVPVPPLAESAEFPAVPSALAAGPPTPAPALSSAAQVELSHHGETSGVVVAAFSNDEPLPRLSKGRAPTVALSDDDLEEFLDDNRQERRSINEEPVEFDVDVDVETPALPLTRSTESAARDDRDDNEGWDLEPGADPTMDRAPTPVDRPLAATGVPVVLPEISARSHPTPTPTNSGPIAPSPAAPAAPPPAANGGVVIAAHRATPPPAPAKPPPAPPKKVAEKRAAPASSPSHPPEERSKQRSKVWFAEVFDEDYLRTLPFLTPQATQSEAELVAASLGISPGAKLLDVGCGYGRHAMELAARGYHVVGLDLSTPLLVRGGEEALRRGLTINFIRGDMRELDFDGQFDGAYCLFSTFGYFDDETNKKTAGNIARALRPGGKCVFEILNRDYVIADLPTRVWWEGDGCVVLEEVDFNYYSSRISVNRSVVFDDGRNLEQEISIRAYSLHEVGKLMLAAGFRVLEVSGSYQTRGRFFGNQSRHIIVVAERTA